MFALAESPQQQLINNLANLENANLTAMAVLTLLLWDWLISVEREVKHFWRPRWTLGTLLYFANRIIPVSSNIVHITTTVVSWSPEIQQRMCKPTLITLNICYAASFSIVQIIMSLRTYALYDCNKPLLVVLLFLSVANMVNQVFWITYPHSHGSHDVLNPLPAPYNGCLLVGALKYPTWAKYIPLLVFEALLLVLTLYKFVVFVQSGSKAMVPKVLFRDGFIGFVAVILATVFGIVILIVRPQSLLTLGQVLAPVIPVLVASHMLLNLRDVMRISSIMIDSNNGSHTQAIASPWIVTGSKSTTEAGQRSKVRGPPHHFDTTKWHAETPPANTLSPGTRGMELSHSASGKSATTAAEERSLPVFSRVIPGLYDEQPVGFVDSLESNEEGGSRIHFTSPSTEYMRTDLYADGGSDDEGEDDSLDGYHHHRRRHASIAVSIPPLEEIELGERIPAPTRAHQSPAIPYFPYPGEVVVRARGDNLADSDARDGQLRTARRTPGPSHDGRGQGSDGGSTID